MTKGAFQDRGGRVIFPTALLGQPATGEENGRDQVLSWLHGWWGWWMTPGSWSVICDKCAGGSRGWRAPAEGQQASFQPPPSSSVTWNCCAAAPGALTSNLLSTPSLGEAPGERKAWHEGCILTKQLQSQQESGELQTKLKQSGSCMQAGGEFRCPCLPPPQKLGMEQRVAWVTRDPGITRKPKI